MRLHTSIFLTEFLTTYHALPDIINTLPACTARLHFFSLLTAEILDLFLLPAFVLSASYSLFSDKGSIPIWHAVLLVELFTLVVFPGQYINLELLSYVSFICISYLKIQLTALASQADVTKYLGCS